MEWGKDETKVLTASDIVISGLVWGGWLKGKVVVM